jgi:hypothetical protein
MFQCPLQALDYELGSMEPAFPILTMLAPFHSSHLPIAMLIEASSPRDITIADPRVKFDSAILQDK